MRGQGSIEYLLIIAAVFVVFGSITIPQLVNPSQETSRNVKDLAQARDACDKIANAINGVYSNSEGAVMTEFVQISRGWDLEMSKDNLRIGLLIDNERVWVDSKLEYGFNTDVFDIQSGSYNVIVKWDEEKEEKITPKLENNKIQINLKPGGGS